MAEKQQPAGVRFITAQNPDEVGRQAADIVAAQLREKPASVFVFPTGKTPLPLYAQLRERTARGEVDWRQAKLFHLDEYIRPDAVPGLPDEALPYKSFTREIDEQLWQSVSARKFYFKDYTPRAYQQTLTAESTGGRPDLVILGIGGDGHIAFNMPELSAKPAGNPAALAESRLTDINPATRRANFGDKIDDPALADKLPTQAKTLGLNAILSARHIVLLATKGKEAIIAKAFASGVAASDSLPASWLNTHPRVTVITDFSL